MPISSPLHLDYYEGKGAKAVRRAVEVAVTVAVTVRLAYYEGGRAKLSEGRGAKLGEPKLGDGRGAKIGEPCPKVRLSQDRMPISSPLT
jgi:hypothetical protein